MNSSVRTHKTTDYAVISSSGTTGITITLQDTVDEHSGEITIGARGSIKIGDNACKIVSLSDLIDMIDVVKELDRLIVEQQKTLPK